MRLFKKNIREWPVFLPLWARPKPSPRSSQVPPSPACPLTAQPSARPGDAHALPPPGGHNAPVPSPTLLGSVLASLLTDPGQAMVPLSVLIFKMGMPNPTPENCNRVHLHVPRPRPRLSSEPLINSTQCGPLSPLSLEDKRSKTRGGSGGGSERSSSALPTCWHGAHCPRAQRAASGTPEKQRHQEGPAARLQVHAATRPRRPSTVGTGIWFPRHWACGGEITRWH